MKQIYVDAGLLFWLSRMVDPSLVFHLYVNNVAPTKATVLGDFTEASWTNYASISVGAASFVLNSVSAGHIGTTIAAPISFAESGAGTDTAYGYYITEPTFGNLLAAGIFDGAPITKALGDLFMIVPIVGDFSQFG